MLLSSVIIALTSTTWTRAQPEGPAATRSPAELAEASRLFEQGAALHASGRFAEAARSFAEADDVAPDAAALEAALLAVLETDDAVLAMRLASRTAREPASQPLTRLAERARRRFAERVGRVVVHCDGCEASIDGEKIAPGIASVVEVGVHEVTIVVGGHRERRSVDVEPSSIVTLLPVGPPAAVSGDPSGVAVPSPSTPAPVASPPTRVADSAGPSPVWFWVGVGLTGASLGGTIASAVDTASKREDFEAAPSRRLADAGEAAQLRTNALIGVTAGLAVVTGVLGIFVVDWGDDQPVAEHVGSSARAARPAAMSLSVSPMAVTLRGWFP